MPTSQHSSAYKTILLSVSRTARTHSFISTSRLRQAMRKRQHIRRIPCTLAMDIGSTFRKRPIYIDKETRRRLANILKLPCSLDVTPPGGVTPPTQPAP